MFRATILFAFCSVIALPASAQQQQFGEWQFQVPAGWQLSSQGDHALLTPADIPSGSIYIKLFPGQQLTGDLQSWLETQATQDTQGMNVIQSKSAPFRSNGPEAFQKVVAVQNHDGRRAARTYVAESPALGRAELFLFYGTIPEAGRYTASMTAFSNSLHFTGMPATGTQQLQSQPALRTPLAADTSGPSLFSGWYVRSMPRTVPGPNFTFAMNPAWEYYRFFTNGWVYTSFPAGGDLDSIACPQAGVAEGKCERFALQGNMITIGRERAKTLEMISANEIKISGVATWRLRPITTALAGTYEAVSGGGGLGTASLAINELTFSPNGTFSTSRTSAVNSTTSASSASAYRNSGGSGQYTISGYDLHLNYSSGQAVTTKILAPSDNDRDLLIIGSSTYMRKTAKR